MKNTAYLIAVLCMSRQFACRWRGTVCFFLWILLFPLFVSAEEANVIKYRRMYVPDDEIVNTLFRSWSLPMDRNIFERRIEQFEQQAETQSFPQPLLSQIVLKAKLEGRQLTSGQGFFTFHPDSRVANSVRLDPLTFAVSSPYWDDDTKAVLFCDSDGITRLMLPSHLDKSEHRNLQFQWSLQSRKENRNGIVFDLSLPSCLSVELQIDIPETMVLTTSAGLVLPEEKNQEGTDIGFRTWRILLGHHSQAVLTITEDNTLSSVKQKTAYRQLMRHLVTLEGLTTYARIIFDDVDSRPNELRVKLEHPLRPISVKYGDRSAPWTRHAVSEDSTEIRIDLSPFAKEENLEFLIEALGQLQENQHWHIPRVQVTSPDVFWMSTRCGINVNSPLRTRDIVCHHAVQEVSRTSLDWAEWEVNVFQFFQEDAQIELNVFYSIPQVAVNSVVQTDWNNTEIRSTVMLACNVTEGERFVMNFPVSDHWIVDSVTPYSPVAGTLPAMENPVFLWNMLEANTLSVQLKRPLKPKNPVLLQLSCRYINSSQEQFRLAELSPLVLSHRHGETHYIATQLNLTDYTLRFNAETPVSNVPQFVRLGNHSLELMGNRYLLDSHTQDIRFELERTQPNYTADISGNAEVENQELMAAFRFHCTPVDSSVDRVFVHFTPSHEDKSVLSWTWSLNNETNSSHPLRTRKLLPDELKELLPLFEPQYRSEDLERGEVWEIRLGEMQSLPFTLSANAVHPLADSMTIPLASLPLASSQKGKITVAAPQSFDYQIVSSRLDSLPIVPVPWNQYQPTRASFRYDPQEELCRSQSIPLLLKKSTPNEQIALAWVWSLRLDSQYEPDGIVRNKALFLVENKGKDVIKLKLPSGITVDDVTIVWLDSQQIPWQFNEDQGTIDVILPVGRRFVSIVLEYLYQDKPLTQQRKLRPRYPSADVPILSGSWISWFPPEFEVSLRRGADSIGDRTENNIVVSKVFDYFTTGTTYRTYFTSLWDEMFHSGQRRQETEIAAQYFFDAIAKSLQKNTTTTWGDLIGSEQVLSDVKLRLAHNANRVEHLIDTKLLIDTQALTLLGITPATPLDNTATIHEQGIRERFERAGLVLLIAYRTRSDDIKEYVFALTTPATLSLNRQLKPVPVGYCVRMVPFDFIDSALQSETPWIPILRWLSETPLSSIPWSASAQVAQRSALTSDWNAYSLPMNVEQALYIVHRKKMAALQWIACLAIILFSFRKPFSSPLVLFILLIVFELTARSVAQCYVGIPSGAFLGAFIAIGFVLIRSQIDRRASEEPSRFTHHDSTECSASFVQTSLHVRSVLLFALLTLFGSIGVPVTAQTFTEQMSMYSQQKEPYRVIYPTDSEHRIVGEQVLLPVEFYDLLFRDVELKNTSADLPQWNIIKAVYQGSLLYGSSGTIECSDDFKVVYDIHLASSSTTISLPNTLPIQGRYYWDSVPILPIDNAKNDSLSFVIENETPGKHVLEIALHPKIAHQTADESYQIAFAIPKVPDSTLRLNVPSEMPPIRINESQGAVTENTMLSPVFSAELGTIPQLSLSWIDNPNRSKTLVSDVEQFFRIKAKYSQIELEALFRFRIDGGKVNYLTIQHDPRWSRSGQFSCLEHQLAQRLETDPELRSLDNFSSSPSNVTQINFQTPVSGTVTLQANYVLRDVTGSGIGNLRLPDFKALQARITKSMLAVYADPHLEVRSPQEGRSSGFEAGWQGKPVTVPFYSNEESILEFAGSMLSGLASTAQELPIAEYDLTKTKPAWVINVRAKKNNSTAAISQSIQFDSGKSQVHVLGEFTAETNVFQQYFTADRSIQIDTIEVKNAQNESVECRLQQIAPKTMPEQYVIFFKNPVTTKKYTIIIRGFCETNIQDPAPQPVHLLTFSDTQITQHTLNFFKTSAVIAGITVPEQGGWSKIDVSALTSTPFTSSTSLGTWQRVSATESSSLESLFTDIVKESEQTSVPLQYELLPNHPRLQCKTIFSLQPSDSDDYWTMTLNFTGNVTEGELKSLQFQWDERYGIIQSIEPSSMVQSFGQYEGKPTLILTPNKPMRGEQKIKITVSINTPGMTVALPNMLPLPSGIDHFESELFVDLPRQWNQEIIPWELNLLETVENHTTDDSRLFYRAVDNNFKVSINQIESRLTALFYDIGFLVRRRNTIIGAATIDLRNRGQDSFVLQMPQGYELIQISSACLLLNRTQLNDGNRWRVDIGTSNYPQRISILFRTTLPHSLRQWNREQITTVLQFPVLEGVTVQETVWSVLFEGDLPSLNVVSASDRREGIGAMAPPDLFGQEVVDHGNHSPMSGRESALSLIGLNLIREQNLLRVLNSLPGTVSAQQEETQHWFSHWSEEWNTIADKVDFQVAHLPLSTQSIKPKLIVRSENTAAEKKETPGIISAFLDTISTNTREALKVNKEQRVQEKFGAIAETLSKQSVPLLNSQVYWQGRISEKTQYLFGAEEGVLRVIRLTSLPSNDQWGYRIADDVWLWVSLALWFPIILLLAVRWVYWMELWLQFPHFWGMIAGVLLWTFLPQSFAGLLIIGLTVLSLFRPAWTRHRSMTTPF